MSDAPDEIIAQHVAQIVRLAPHNTDDRSYWLEGYRDALILAIGEDLTSRIMLKAREALASRPRTRFDR